ncbi:glycosyltransferase family 2 protein [Paenibacillus sp. CF384]|uniref:glycosyltransferase family 2 protein n=1 Tax=Paenibacillus sp. CF384 TaxID=1884382 RepID=UPI00089CEFD3|nr:glycosyltransferase family 2 protein [Paenibacillus sp. CF384]SDW82003.1 Glycosyltransferase, GT2 family [Paenibacillus sp. CF384]
MTGMTSIIIPSYNGLSLLQDAIEAIRRYTDSNESPYEIIVVDNGSTDGTCQWCIREGIPCLSLARNTGFPFACNRGLRMARGEYLMLLNNDVTVSAGWLPALIRALTARADIGMVGPVTNYISGRQQVEHPFSSMEEFHGQAAAALVREAKISEPIMRLVGFCMLFKRSLYERIGELDERFTPGHYEDDDYCFRARMHGYSLLMCRDVFVHHRGSVSFKRSNPQELQQLVERNRKHFIAKWKVDPANFMY